MKISFSKTFEKEFKKYDKKLQKRVFEAIKKLPNGDIKKLTSNEEPPIYRIRIDSRGQIYKRM